MTKEWTDKKELFEVLDGKELVGEFLPTVIKKAKEVAAGSGICVVQNFEPILHYFRFTPEEIGWDASTAL